MNTLLKLKALPTEDFRLLCFYAYMLVQTETESLRKKFTKISPYKKVEAYEALKRLEEEGFLEDPYYRSYSYYSIPNYRIGPEYACIVLYYMQLTHPDWEKQIRSLLPTRDHLIDARIWLMSVCKRAVSGNVGASILAIPKYELVKSYLNKLLYEEEMKPFFDQLPDNILEKMLADEALFLINNDFGELSDSLLTIVADRRSLSSQLRYAPVTTLVQLSHMIETGDETGINSHASQTQSMYLMYMLRWLKERKYDVAIECYEHALAARDTLFYAGNLPVFTSLYTLALANSQNAQNKMKLAKIASQSYTYYYSPNLASIILAKILMDDAAELPVKWIADLHRHALEGNGWINQKLAIIMAKKFEIPDEQILLHYPDAFCNAEKVTMSAFATRLADELLSEFRVKPMWQRVLENIFSEEQKRSKRTSAAKTEEKETRLAYFANNREYIEVREQKRLKSGAWSSGRALSESAYASYKQEDMDSVDLKIRGLLRSSRHLTLKNALPLLEGSDKLYVGSKAPYQQCSVKEDKPYLTTARTDDSILIKSNIPYEQLKQMGKEDNLLYDIQGGEAKFFHVPSRVGNYLKALVGVGKFPIEAENQLKEIFEQFKDIVEIHSEMIEGGSNLPQCEGLSQVTLRVTSDHGDYLVKAIVRPLEGGSVECKPGSGDQIIFDQDKQGNRWQVLRHKNAEGKNLSVFTSMMEDLGCMQVNATTYSLDPFALLELMEQMPDYADSLCMEWPEGEKIKLNVADPAKWNLNITSGRGGWFELEGEVSVDDNTILSIGQLLELLGQGHGRFIRLSDKQFLSISDSLRKQLSRIDAVAQNVRGKVRIPQIGASLIGDALNGEIDIEHPAIIDDLRKKIRESQKREIDVPDTLNATLRDYQETGFRWMDKLTHWGAGVCLADDMGLGKTVQTIAYLLAKCHEGAAMVVAPASVVPNWRKELARFAPSLQVSVLNDLTGDDRAETIDKAQAGCVVLSTYGLLISEEEHLIEREWNTICLDEAHSIKNSSTKTSGVCMKLKAQNRIILTGTPIQNHLGELWNLFQFINPGLLGSMEQFTKKYINPIEGAQDKARQSQLKRIVQPFMLRRTKQEVVAELPDKQEITLPVELNKDEMAIYELIRREAKAELEAASEESVALSVNALAMITKLRMAACSAHLAEKKWIGPSSKLNVFCDLVEEICKSGNRVLVFSQFTSFLEMAQQQLKDKGWKDGDYFYLDGSTPIKMRSQMVDAFQHGDCPLFMISLKAGGLGLNLTGANYVIHLDPWWNPAIEQQATDRAYRIGQQQKVTVYHLISQHTIEEKIVRLHQTKRDLADSLLDGTDMSHKISASELLKMIGNE